MIAIIVEDEQYAADNLNAALKRTCPHVIVKTICKNVPDAISAITEIKPELIFLDIHLNGKHTAFEILDTFSEYTFKVIFTTAYEEFAMTAFEYNAIHFLLKPYSDEKLADAVKRVTQLSLGEQKENIKGLKLTNEFIKQHSDFFAFRKNNGTYTVRNYNDIMFLEADGSSVTVFFNDESSECTTNKPLNEYENILKNRGFIRISKKYIVNLHFIAKYKKPPKVNSSSDIISENKKEGAGGSVILKNEKLLPVSRQYVQDLKDVLNIV